LFQVSALIAETGPVSLARPLRRSSSIDVKSDVAERRRMEQDIKHALAENGFVLHYQPRFCLSTGKLQGVEALIRWSHRKRGLIPPGSFIPLAERSGIINEIGSWVLTNACREAASWSAIGVEAGLEPGDAPLVSVNVSARQLVDDALLDQVALALESSGLPPEQLELEITEAVLLDDEVETLLILAALRDLGVGLSLDDFGTGAASLFTLKRLPLTAMKLDRSLVRDLPHQAEDRAIISAVIHTGHALGLDMIAEGVETAAQQSFLAEIGCDAAQGYFFSQPLSAEKLAHGIRHGFAGGLG
jgi:EAL domain-containing protein (putative c-di-GMP-specific phosphodiesterase class I)